VKEKKAQCRCPRVHQLPFQLSLASVVHLLLMKDGTGIEKSGISENLVKN
jgi:hypothetical protein